MECAREWHLIWLQRPKILTNNCFSINKQALVKKENRDIKVYIS